MKLERVIKVAAFICFIVIGIALLIIRGSAPQGYKVSIYTTVSTVVWPFLIAGIIYVIGIMTQQIYIGQHERRGLLVFYSSC